MLQLSTCHTLASSLRCTAPELAPHFSVTVDDCIAPGLGPDMVLLRGAGQEQQLLQGTSSSLDKA